MGKSVFMLFLLFHPRLMLEIHKKVREGKSYHSLNFLHFTVGMKIKTSKSSIWGFF